MQINEMPLMFRGILGCIGRYYLGRNFGGGGIRICGLNRAGNLIFRQLFPFNTHCVSDPLQGARAQLVRVVFHLGKDGLSNPHLVGYVLLGKAKIKPPCPYKGFAFDT